MLDIRWLRQEPDVVKAALAKRDPELPATIDRILSRDVERREALTRVNDLKAQRNEASKRVGELKRAGGDASELIAQTKAVGEEIAKLDDLVRACDEEIQGALLIIPSFISLFKPKFIVGRKHTAGISINTEITRIN